MPVPEDKSGGVTHPGESCSERDRDELGVAEPKRGRRSPRLEASEEKELLFRTTPSPNLSGAPKITPEEDLAANQHVGTP